MYLLIRHKIWQLSRENKQIIRERNAKPPQSFLVNCDEPKNIIRYADCKREPDFGGKFVKQITPEWFDKEDWQLNGSKK